MLAAKLHIQSISRFRNVMQLKEALETLSPDLNAMYEKNIDRIPDEDREIAYDVFSWIAVACRPLRMLELQHALVTNWMDRRSIHIHVDELDLPERILEACGGLVTTRFDHCGNPDVILVRK